MCQPARLKTPPRLRPLVTALAVLSLSLGWAAAVPAQPRTPQVEKVSGKLVEVRQRGRIITLVVDVDGTQQDVALTPRVEFAVTATGDDGFLAKDAYIATEAVESNKLFFSQNFTVYVGKGKKPAAVLAKAPPLPGRSQNAWFVVGSVVSRRPHASYETYDEIIVRARGNASVLLERDKASTITVAFTDIDMASPGSTVELESTPGTGGRLALTRVTVKLPERLKAEEFFADKRRGT